MAEGVRTQQRNSGSPPFRHPPGGGRVPTFAKPRRRLSHCKASHTVRQRRGHDWLLCDQSLPAPVLSTPRGVDLDIGHRRIASHAKRCNPQRTCRHRTRRRTGRPLPGATALCRDCSASRAMPQPGKNKQPHTAPRQCAQQNNVCIELTAPNTAFTNNNTVGRIHQHTPQHGPLT